MTEAKRLDLLESWVDELGLCGVLELLADICDQKEEHIRTNWTYSNSEALAGDWRKAARTMMKLAEKLG